MVSGREEQGTGPEWRMGTSVQQVVAAQVFSNRRSRRWLGISWEAHCEEREHNRSCPGEPVWGRTGGGRDVRGPDQASFGGRVGRSFSGPTCAPVHARVHARVA